MLFDWKKSLRTGFEPVRVTPSDFESDALTTRPSQLIFLLKYYKRVNFRKNSR